MKHLKTIMAVLTLLASVACTKVVHDGKATGHVNFTVSSNQQVADQTKSNVSDYTDLPAKDDFTITIKNATSVSVWSGLIGDWDPATLLPVGDYTVTADFGDAADEGFDKPYFTGSSSFTVVGAETEDVSVPVSLGNSIVKIVCTENFRNYFTDYGFSLKRFSQEIVAFDKDETRGAFIDCMDFSVDGSFVNAAGTEYSFSKEYTGIEEATAYTITFDITNVGGVKLIVTFNDTVETVDLGDYELND